MGALLFPNQEKFRAQWLRSQSSEIVGNELQRHNSSLPAARGIYTIGQVC
jgi:hypothetical protein